MPFIIFGCAVLIAIFLLADRGRDPLAHSRSAALRKLLERK
jgi:hypothetical protein